MQNMLRSIISFVIRLCGVIICSTLLHVVPVTYTVDSGSCNCALIFVLYLIICIVATLYNMTSNEKSLFLCIVSLLIGIVLFLIAIYTGHLVCAGALLCLTVISIAIEYSSTY